MIKKLYKYRFVVLGIIPLMLLHWVNAQTPTRFYIRTDVEIYLEVKSKLGEVLFKDTLISTDLFVPGYFETNRTFPLNFQLTTIAQQKSLSMSFEVEKTFSKYVIIDLKRSDGTLVIDKSYRFLQPIFQ